MRKRPMEPSVGQKLGMRKESCKKKNEQKSISRKVVLVNKRKEKRKKC